MFNHMFNTMKINILSCFPNDIPMAFVYMLQFISFSKTKNHLLPRHEAKINHI